ncbi:MAG: beta-ketoacyl-[acyl-carrier-protein] synthase family protein [Gammaproteobacteria bacterium]|nr:beta-ketoacyl-[acyl-carrier-protein] synthase family protein [Gammaproteobacteria bacterium]
MIRTREKAAVVTGMGVVTPLSNNLERLWLHLLAGDTAVRHWDDLAAEGYRIPLAARVEGFGGDDAFRGSRLAVAAARQAVAHAGLQPMGTLAVLVGTTMGESAAFEGAAAGVTTDLTQASAQSFPRAIQQALGTTGPLRAYATACAAGNYAIGAAAQMVSSGQVDYALAGGVEPFSRIALAGFSRSRAMSGELCRPFDRRRMGMQLGEAAGFLLLERQQDALARGAPILAAIGALGLSCDAYHPTAPTPDGSGMARAMELAIRHADLSPQDIHWICAHGSGTRASDAAEAQAIQRVFGEHRPPVSAIKGALGHSMGAATAVEAVVTILALRHRCLPPTTHLCEPDPDCPLDMVVTARQPERITHVLNCGYGFGGLNSALLLEAR